MKFVEQHRRDAFKRGIVEDQAGENALGDHLDARAFRHFGAEPHPVSNRLADGFAKRLRHPLGGGAGGEPARFQHQDFAFAGPRLAGQHQRHPRGLAGAGRRHQHRSRAVCQGGKQVRQGGVDRQRGEGVHRVLVRCEIGAGL